MRGKLLLLGTVVVLVCTGLAVYERGQLLLELEEAKREHKETAQLVFECGVKLEDCAEDRHTHLED